MKKLKKKSNVFNSCFASMQTGETKEKREGIGHLGMRWSYWCFSSEDQELDDEATKEVDTADLTKPTTLTRPIKRPWVTNLKQKICYQLCVEENTYNCVNAG